MRLLLLLTALGTGIFLPGKIHGHGVEVFDVTDGLAGARLVYFKYSTGEPMMYAKVKLYPPSRPEAESLQSVTDRNGIFPFVPDEEGEWRVEAEDGMGHRGEISVKAAAGEDSGGTGGKEAEKRSAAGERAAGTGGGKPVLGVITGLSLIINIFSGWYIGAWFLRSRKGGLYAHQ
jgi:nickel transport protein